MDKTTAAGLLGAKIRALRDTHGWSPDELASRLFVTGNRVTKMELGTDPPNREMVQRLEQVLNAGGALLELYPLLRNESFRDYAVPFLIKQRKAKTIRTFSLIVPGLLQTPEYARAIMHAADPDGLTDIDAAVDQRLERQEVLAGSNAPWLWVVLAESALTTAIGSRAVLRDQIEKLLKDITQPNIHIQILPTGAPSIPGSISLLTSPTGERAAYTEGFDTGWFMQDADDVERYQKVYDRLHAEALGPGKSEEIIRETLGKHT
ncbi:Scr1 family TA system antitoxin-like transcriptional regulator [Streptomyces sp. NPDC051567]|uniref:helix-turn-helix domain-containing protein n=1 Tax=Streptomyces sp. NPDC051567 TaxID=3365660 RepID=UPI0037A7142E